MSTTQKWTEDRVETLVGIVGGDINTEVSADLQHVAAEQLEVSIRSIAAKLRNLDYTVASTAQKTVAKYTEAEEEELRAFVESNAGEFTYAEIAEQVLSGTRTAKEIQGKLLSMELFDMVKPTPKVEVAKKYTDEEEVKFVELMNSGAFLEDIAEAMGRPLNSVRGKALSLTRSDDSLVMPKQKESHATVKVDAFAELGDVSEMTVAEIAAAIDKTERGIKTTLTRRGVTCKDYDGAKKQQKLHG
jgi:DNA-directed RNA polymerase specialized sigma24 family protein